MVLYKRQWLPNVRHSMNNLSNLHTNDIIEVTIRVHNCTLPVVVIKIIHLVQTNIVLFVTVYLCKLLLKNHFVMHLVTTFD